MKKHLLFSRILALVLLFAGTIRSHAQEQVYSLDELTDGWYQLQYTGSRTPAATGFYLLTYTKEFAFQANNKYYPIAAASIDDITLTGSTFFHIYPTESEGQVWLQTINGHYIDDTGRATISPAVSYFQHNGVSIQFQYIYPFAEGENDGAENHEWGFFAGRSYNALETYNVYRVNPDDYNIIKVIVERPEAEKHDYPYQYGQVTYTGDAQLLSLSSVYNEGYFVFPKGVWPDASDFSASEIENYDAEAYFDGQTLVMIYAPAVDNADITYVYYYGDEYVGEETLMGVIGENYPEPKFVFPAYVSAKAPQGTVSKEETFDIQVIISGMPFVGENKGTSVANVQHWYQLVLKNASYLVYEPGVDAINLTYTEVDPDNRAAYEWAFVGDPFGGYKLVNRLAGDAYVLASARTANNDGNGGGNTLAYMQEEEFLDEAADAWRFLVNPSSYLSGVEGFFLGYKDASSGKTINLNNRNNRLAYWDSGADSGSTFYVMEVFAAAETLAKVIAETEESLTNFNAHRGQIGYPTEEAITNISEALDFAKAIAADGETTEEDLYNAASSLETSLSDAIKDVNYPVAGGLYAFVNHQKDGSIITMYMTEDGLAAAPGQTPDEVGDAAFFEAIPDTAAHWYHFYSAVNDSYLVWRGHTGGYNDNKGYLPVKEVTEDNIDFTWILTTSTYSTLEGSFIVFGYRANQAYGTFIFLPDGTFNAWGYSVGYSDTYSNIFTLVSADEPNAINTLSAPVIDATLYDLQGRRVDNPAKGIYIQNGRKVFIR